MLKTIRYPVKHPLLKSLIKYYWVIESQSPLVVNHKLLPVNNIDFIFNLSSTIKYSIKGESEIVPKGFHFNGIREKYYTINQTGLLSVFGISFFPMGLFPILKVPLSEFANKTIELDILIKGFTSDITEKISDVNSISEVIGVIEDEIASMIDVNLIPRKEVYNLLRTFYNDLGDLNINLLCHKYGINQRRLERIFNKYIGVSPKRFYRISRFQEIVRQLEKSNDNLTSYAYNNSYYDQTHFIKDFKLFTGSAPTEFLKHKNSIRQITEFL